MSIRLTSQISSDYNSQELHTLLEDASTDETKSDAVSGINAEAMTLVVEASSGVSGGVVILEGAVTEDYAGTWVPLAQVTTNAASKIFACSVGLAPVSANAVSLPMQFVRARVETAISGGTVDVYLSIKK